MTPLPQTSVSDFSQFCTSIGRAYVSCGGSASRIEDRLSHLGRALGIETEIYATPTGFLVSARRLGPQHGTTTFVRVKDSTVHLSRLKNLEALIESIECGTLTIEQATQQTKDLDYKEAPYELGQVLGIVLIGFSASYLVYSNTLGALMSGIIALVVFALGGLLETRLHFSAIFRNFIECTATYALAGLLYRLALIPAEACAIGALIIIAPGLTWVTAVGELAEHDLISGTSKLMKGFLTLLAMGTSYGICQEIAHRLQLPQALHLTLAQTPGLWLRGLLTSSLLTGFCLIFKIPKRDCSVACLLGLAGWAIAQLLSYPSSFVLAAFAAAFFVGLMSTLASRALKSPDQVFAVPGILTLLPGMIGFLSFQSMVKGKFEAGLELGFQVLLLAGSIVFGLLSAKLMLGPKKPNLSLPQSPESSAQLELVI